MKVYQLINKLKEFNENVDIKFSNDEEGNILHANADIYAVNVEETSPESEAVIIYPLNSKDDIY